MQPLPSPERTPGEGERYRTLLEINNAIISNLTPEPLFRAIARALRRVFPIGRSAIFLQDPEKDILRLFMLESSLPSRYFHIGLEMPAGESHVGRVFQQHDPCFGATWKRNASIPWRIGPTRMACGPTSLFPSLREGSPSARWPWPAKADTVGMGPRVREADRNGKERGYALTSANRPTTLRDDSRTLARYESPRDRTLAQQSPASAVVAVDSVGITVADMDRSVEFYSKVLTFEKVSDVEVWGDAYEHLQGVFGLRMRVVRMRLGDEFIELTEYLAPRGRPIPVDSRSNDRWFQHIAIIVSDMDRAYAWLRQHKVQHASTGPQRLPDWNKNAAGIRAFYFRDPDGHNLEILQFPPDKGDPKWREVRGGLFLGIDHTAIVVGATAASLEFYRDLLGLPVVGESENYGPEQERLNNVFGARLRITALRAAAGPAIEFLEYLTPRDGRPYPADHRANDLMHWQTRLAAGDAGTAAQALRAGKATFVSPGVISLTESALGFTRGFLVRDPDGHAMQVIQR